MRAGQAVLVPARPICRVGTAPCTAGEQLDYQALQCQPLNAQLFATPRSGLRRRVAAARIFFQCLPVPSPEMAGRPRSIYHKAWMYHPHHVYGCHLICCFGSEVAAVDREKAVSSAAGMPWSVDWSAQTYSPVTKWRHWRRVAGKLPWDADAAGLGNTGGRKTAGTS